MNLVDDVDFVFTFCGAVGNFLSDLSNVIYTVVGCSINLDHVHGSSCLDCFTHSAFITGTSIDRMFTVDRFGKDLRHCGLTGSSGPAEQIGMADAVMPDLIGQSCHNMILTLDICEIVWSEFSVKGSITH